MTLRHGLFVAGASGGVTQPQDARLALASLFSGAGVLSGGVVAGNSSGPNMKYDLAAGRFLTARGPAATDGLYLFVNDGTITVDSGNFTGGGPAPSSGSRWDLIWVKHNNAYPSDGFGDANSDPTIGVTCGSAGSTPTKPYGSVPAGALVLAESQVGANITDASHAVITQVAARVTPAGVQAAWTDYVPLMTRTDTGATIASTVGSARFCVIGKTVHCKGTSTANAASSGGGVAVGLPFTARDRDLVAGVGGVFGPAAPTTQSGAVAMLSDQARITAISPAFGFMDIVSGQAFRWNITYELP